MVFFLAFLAVSGLIPASFNSSVVRYARPFFLAPTTSKHRLRRLFYMGHLDNFAYV